MMLRTCYGRLEMLKILYSRIPPSFRRKRNAQIPNEENQKKTGLLSDYEAGDNQSLFAGLLLLYSLKRFWKIGDAKTKYRHHQKPYLSNYPELYFNISHSRDVVLVAFSDSEVGADIQYLSDKRKSKLRLSNKILAEAEIRTLLSYDSTIRTKEFLKCWTKKEAFCKCLGEGLLLYSHYNFNSFGIRELDYNGCKYHFYEEEIENDVFLTVCTKKPNKKFKITEIAPGLILDFYNQLTYN